MENKIKHLYIRLLVREGENVHTHHCLYSTKAENIHFAAELFAARFWGESYRDEYWWMAQNGCMAIKVERVLEISEEKYLELHSLFYGEDCE
jgi:hypothetical protein